LQTIPDEELRLTDSEFRIAAKLRLNLPILRAPCTCQLYNKAQDATCGKMVLQVVIMRSLAGQVWAL